MKFFNKTWIVILCLITSETFAQGIFLKGGYSYIHDIRSRSTDYPYGGTFNIGYSFKKISIYTGLEINIEKTKSYKGYVDSSSWKNLFPDQTVSAGPNPPFSGYTGIYETKFRKIYYIIPIYLDYPIFHSSKFRLTGNAGILNIIESRSFRGSPSMTGKYESRTNYKWRPGIEAGLEAQYTIHKKVNVFLSSEYRFAYFIAGKLGLVYYLNPKN